jgi:hypothetical protein
MILSTNTIKPKVDDSPHRLRHLTSEQAPKRTGGAFNFDGNRYPNVMKRTPKHVKGGIFTDQLRDIAAAKGRAARIAELKRVAALKAQAAAEAKVASKAAPKKRRGKAKRTKKAK